MEKIGSAVASTSGTQYPAPKYHSRYGFQSGRNRPFLAGGALDPPEGSRQPEAICLWGENSPLHPAQEAVEPQLLPVPPQVNSFYHTIPSLLQQLQTEALQFEGGRLQQFYAVWETLTSDPEFLLLVRGAQLEFDDTEFPSSSSPQPHLNKSEMAIIDAEIVKLSRKRVISKCEHSPDQYLSPVFTRPKKDARIA